MVHLVTGIPRAASADRKGRQSPRRGRQALYGLIPAVFLLCGCAAPAAAPPAFYAGARRALTASEQAAIARGLETSLKDPDSARLLWLPFPATVPDGSAFYCGQINAKNGFGGYTGFAPYIAGVRVQGNRVITAGLITIGRGSMANVVMRECAQSGYNPLSAK